MLPLADYLPYLLNRAGSRIAVAFGEELKPHGLTLPMWRVLAALHQTEGQRMGELSEITSIEVSTLSRVVDAMAAKGLVERRRLAADARGVGVHRTQRGRRITETLIPVALSYEEIALSGFSPKEAKAFKEMLVRVFDNMIVLDEQDAAGSKAVS
jgi:DNA-binding MarR family transcriptional regulator